MEERARMQEKLIMIKNKESNLKGDKFDTDTVEKTIAVNDMYIDAIQAKLKILD